MRHWLTAVAGTLALACVLLAIGCPSKPAEPPEPARPVDLRNMDGVTPGSALVLVRDLAGFLRDCGCAGETGGVARMPAAAPVNDVTFVFAGQLFMPRFGSRRTRQEATQQQYEFYVSSTARVFEELSKFGKVIWLPDLGEFNQYRRANVDMSALDAYRHDNPSWHGLPLSANATHLRVGDEVVLEFEMPRANSRGREALVVLRWARDGGKADQLAASAEIGSLAAQANRTSAAQLRLRTLLDSTHPQAGTLLADYRLIMDNKVPRHEALSEVIEFVDVMGAHAGVGRRPLDIMPDKQVLAEAWQDCASCHQAAFDAWKRSPHFKAYYTLLARGRENDARCLPCHVHDFELDARGQAQIEARNQSVNCMTCHEQKTPEKSWLQVCETCHTEVADPKGVYRLHVRNVCSTADAPATKPCTRG